MNDRPLPEAELNRMYAAVKGMYLSQNGKMDQARERLTVAVQRGPLPAAAGYRANLGNLLRRAASLQVRLGAALAV